MKTKSIIVIGNGSSLIDSSLGNKIDEFDEVIRINDFRIFGYEDDVGTKTDIWCTYNPKNKVEKLIRSHIDHGFTIDDLKNITKGIKEIWYVSWNPENLMNSWKHNKSFKQLDIYNRIKRHQSITNSKKLRKHIPVPSTGFMLLWLLTQMYDKIYIAGFDFAGATDSNLVYHHYYKTITLEQESKKRIHTPNKEYEYVKDLIKDGKIEFLEKNTNIIKANFIGNYRMIDKCNKCDKEISLYSWEQLICSYCEEYI